MFPWRNVQTHHRTVFFYDEKTFITGFLDPRVPSTLASDMSSTLAADMSSTWLLVDVASMPIFYYTTCQCFLRHMPIFYYTTCQYWLRHVSAFSWTTCQAITVPILGLCDRFKNNVILSPIIGKNYGLFGWFKSRLISTDLIVPCEKK